MAGGAGPSKSAQAGATLCNSGAEVYRSATNRPQAGMPLVGGEAGTPWVGRRGFPPLSPTVRPGPPGRGPRGFQHAPFPPIALAEPGREPADDEPKGKRAEQEQE